MFAHLLATRNIHGVYFDQEVEKNVPSVFSWRKTAKYRNLQLYKHDEKLALNIDCESMGIGYITDNGTRLASTMASSFCIGNTICANNRLVDETGRTLCQLPDRICTMYTYNAFPWIPLQSGILFNAITRQRLYSNHVHAAKAIVLSPTRCCIGVIVENRCTLLFRLTLLYPYTDIARKLSSLLGVLPVDVLNTVYSRIKTP